MSAFGRKRPSSQSSQRFRPRAAVEALAEAAAERGAWNLKNTGSLRRPVGTT